MPKRTLRIATADATRPAGKSAPRDSGAAARSPGEAITTPTIHEFTA